MLALAANLVGLALRSPILVGSGPATEGLDTIKRAEDAGAGGIYTKSIGAHATRPFGPTDRRRYRWIRGFGVFMKSTYLKEILPLEVGAELVARAKAACDIPIIASVLYPNLETAEDVAAWIKLCRTVEAAGADAIQLDFFYLDCRRTSDERTSSVMEAVNTIATSVSVPVLPKLNVGMDWDLIAGLASRSGLKGFSYLDTLRAEPYIDIYDRGRPIYDGPLFREGRSMSVVGGEPLLPFTLNFTQRLRRLTPKSLAAGGGLSSHEDVLRCLMLGADAVHITSFFMRRGLDQITLFNKRILRFLNDQSYASVRDIIGLAYRGAVAAGWVEEKPFEDRIVEFLPDRCTRCGVCERLTACRSFASVPYEFIGNCDGCTLCIDMCGPRALTLVQTTRNGTVDR